MPNIVVTKTGNSINVDFGDYGPIKGSTKRSYDCRHIAQLELHSDHVFIYMAVTNETWPITYDASYSGSDYFIVDTVAGGAPSSEEDLFNKIAALR